MHFECLDIECLWPPAGSPEQGLKIHAVETQET